MHILTQTWCCKLVILGGCSITVFHLLFVSHALYLFFFLIVCLHVWLQFASVCPDVVIQLVWSPFRGKSWKCCVVVFLFVYCELWTNKQVNYYYYYCYYIFSTDVCYFRYDSALSGTPKSFMYVCCKLCADNHGLVKLYTTNRVLTSNRHFCELETIWRFNTVELMQHFIKQ